MDRQRISEVFQYAKEAFGALGEYMAGLITEPELDAEIARLRRKYGFEDKG